MTQLETEFLPTRGTLLNRLKNMDDAGSWQQFFDTYWKLIYGVALKAGLNDAEAQDVVQETVIAVARNIGKFKYDPQVCAFKTWLLQVVRSRISNQMRKNKRHKSGRVSASDDATGTQFIDQIPDNRSASLDALWEQEWEKNLTDAAINHVKRQVDPEQYQLFDFYVLRGWEAGKVAETFGVSKARVYLTKHRISAIVAKEVRRLAAKIV
jgi:RNA polymerase sigma-70 factor (ECF subfamily)